MAGDVLVGGPAQTQSDVSLLAQSRACTVSAEAAPVDHAARYRKAGTLIILLAVIALCLKLTIAYTTLGTNDAVTFYTFARSLSEHGLQWTYERGVAWLPKGPIFNHPPIVAGFIQVIRDLSHLQIFEVNGVSFSFLLRLPGILADLVVIVALVGIARKDPELRNAWWAIGLLALSPVSLMISGFHGNTDPVMVMFLFLAGAACMIPSALLCGLMFALSCQIKIIPLLFLPIFICFWHHRRVLRSFILMFSLVSLVMWWEPLTTFPALFIKNVLSYGSYWGLWGITYGLRSTGNGAFSAMLVKQSMTQILIATSLKMLILASVVVIGWRRRNLDGRGVLESIALAWIVFFVFSPGVCAQYLVWPAPFLLILSPRLFAIVTASCSLFLFVFYNTICHGLPWYLGVSTNALVSQWAPWGLIAWATFVGGLALYWKLIVPPGFKSEPDADAAKNQAPGRSLLAT